MDVTTAKRPDRPARGGEGTAPGIPGPGEVRGGHSREGELVVVSSGSRIRPRKRLRATPRCSVPGISGAIVFLSRSEGRPPEAVPAPTGSRVVRPADPAVSPETARLYRHLDAVVTFGGMTLLGALIGFMLGERLLPPVAGGPSARAEGASSSPSAERGPAGSGRIETGSADPAPSRTFPAFDLSATASPFAPPWRDSAAMRQGNAPITVEAFAAMVRDNRRLDAEVVALQAETMSLEMALLDRELKMFAAGLPLDEANAREGATDAASAPPAEAPETSPAWEGDVVNPVQPADAPPELELFASETDSAPLEPSAAGGRAIASAALGAPQQRLVIAEVPPGGTAESVGLMPGDILLAINDEEIHGMESLISDHGDDTSGGLHELTIVRDGARFPLAYGGNPAALSLRLDWVDPVFSER